MIEDGEAIGLIQIVSAHTVWAIRVRTPISISTEHSP